MHILIQNGSIEIYKSDADWVRMSHSDFKALEPDYEPVPYRKYDPATDPPWAKGEKYFTNLNNYKTAWLSANTQAAIDQVPNWDVFIDKVLPSNAYQKISLTSKQKALNRVEMSVSAKPSTSAQIARLKAFWNEAIGGIPILSVLTASEIDFLKTSAAEAKMKFSFDSKGLMI